MPTNFLSSRCTRMWWKPFLIARGISESRGRTWSQTVEILSYWNLGVLLTDFRRLRSTTRRNVLLFLYESKSERRNARNQKFTNSAINKASCFSDNRWFGRTNPFGDLEKWRRTPESIHSITGNGVLIVGHAFKWLLKFPWWKVSVIYYTAEDWGVWDEEPELQGREMILSWKRMGENYPVFEKQWNSWKALLKTLRMNFVTF